MDAPLRYGIIGTGMMGVEHMLNILLIPGSVVTAVADPHPPSLAAARALAGPGARAYEDYREMLHGDEFDAVIVATPNHTHADVLRDVFETGKHVLCEKPLCTTLADCEWVSERAERYAGLFWVGMEYRYSPPVTRFVEEVHGGAAGKVRMLSIKEHRFPFLKKVGDWNRFNANSGGTLVEKSCHHFDLMRHVLRSEPVSVYASGGMDVNHLDEVYEGARPDIIDNAFVTVEFESGARAMHDLCMFAEASTHSQELAATGDTGKVECFMPEGTVVRGRRTPRSLDPVTVKVPEAAASAGQHHGASYYQHLAFQRSVREGGPAAVSARDGLKAVAMGLAAQISIAEKRPVMMAEMGL
jgi:predicted dehydrogenase